MADKIIIGLERLSTLDIMGVEYPYDTTDANLIKRLEGIMGGMHEDFESIIQACKDFITTVFRGNPEPVERISEVYGMSAGLWMDVVVQIGEYVANPKIKGITDRVAALKAASKGGNKG